MLLVSTLPGQFVLIDLERNYFFAYFYYFTSLLIVFSIDRGKAFPEKGFL